MLVLYWLNLTPSAYGYGISMELVSPEWDVEKLEKAYRRGFMAGMVGKPVTTCPHTAELAINAWEAGWFDGKEQYDIKYSQSLQSSM